MPLTEAFASYFNLILTFINDDKRKKETITKFSARPYSNEKSTINFFV